MPSPAIKKGAFIAGGLLLLLGITAWVLYLNREKLLPQVKEVKYLRAEMARDTALVKAGLLVQNYAPLPFRIDSVNYIIRNTGEKLGWGGQVIGKKFAPFGDRVLNFRLYLNTEKYREHLLRQQGADSLDLEVAMAVYVDLPFMQPQTITINRTVTTAIPKAPAFKIDTLMVKSFSPKAGYTFLLQLNTGNTNLPDLKIQDLAYEVRFADGTFIDGRVDSTFILKEGEYTIQVPLNLETAEMVALIRKKLSGKKQWHYQAKASAIASSKQPLFEKFKVSISKDGTLDASALGSGGGELALPSVKQIKNLRLVRKEKNTFLEAGLLVYNPGPLPLYIDSARYTVRYQGKTIAQGSRNYEKTLPKEGTQELLLQLAMNNDRYRQMMAQVKGQEEIPLEIKLDLIYDLKNNPRQRLSIKKTIQAPVPASGGLQVAGLKLKELDPTKGAHLLLRLEAQNNQLAGLELDDLNYKVLVGKDLELTGRSAKSISVGKGISEIEIPLNLSADDVNLLVRRLLQGTQDWHYQFSGSALVSSENGLLERTPIALQTSGELETGSGGNKNLMPSISKIDSLAFTIHYDSAWVKIHLQVHNPLPVALNIQHLDLDVVHNKDSFAELKNGKPYVLPANGTTGAWLYLAVDYAAWERHINHHQLEDSLQLSIPITITGSVGNLAPQKIPIQFHPQIPMPYSPVTILQKSKFGGIGRGGLKFNGDVLVQNANVKDLQISNTHYQINLENGVDMCGTIKRTYTIPLNQSNLKFPFSLGPGEAIKMMTRMFFGPPKMHYKINATARISTQAAIMQNVHFTFENHNVTDLKQTKEPSPRFKKSQVPQVVQQ